MTTTTFDPSEGPSAEQMAAEQAALAQGEKLIQAENEDRNRMYEQADASNEDVQLIGGKFKSQDDLLKAYEELQKKLGQDTPEPDEEPSEEQPEASEEESETEEEEAEPSELVGYMEQLSKVYDEHGSINDADIDKLSQMDSKDLIKAYLEYYGKSSQQATMQQEAVNEIYGAVGGQENYNEMVSWAGQNLPQEDIDSFNQVTNSNNPVAIKFAVEALYNRYRSAEGYEAPLVTGKKASGGVKPYRSQAELARDIADPRYHNDPAFRQDVEQRLARSNDLL